MPVDSLADMARRASMKSYRGITDIGDIPYELLRPVLLKIENPEQLHTLEQNSPQIVGKDREIWINMLKRDIPDYETKPHEPSDPKNWFKVYRKLKKEAQQEMIEGDAKLKAALNSAQAKKGVPTTRLISSDQVPRPTVRRRQAITYDYMSGRTGSKGAHKMSVVDRIRNQGRASNTAKMSRPTHELQNRSSGVVKPPQSFMRDIRQQKLASMPLAEAREAMGYTQVKAPKTIARPPGSAYDLTQDREARLRSLKAGKQADRAAPTRERDHGGSGRTNNLTLDFLEDDDDDDELFGTSSSSRVSPPRTKENPRSQFGSPQPTAQKRKDAPKMFMPGQATKRKRPGPGVT